MYVWQQAQLTGTKGRGLIHRDTEKLLFSAHHIYALSHRQDRGLTVGDPSGGGTPGPISNPVVKPTRADGTWGVGPWESRSSPTSDLFFFTTTTPPITLTAQPPVDQPHTYSYTITQKLKDLFNLHFEKLYF